MDDEDNNNDDDDDDDDGFADLSVGLPRRIPTAWLGGNGRRHGAVIQVRTRSVMQVGVFAPE